MFDIVIKIIYSFVFIQQYYKREGKVIYKYIIRIEYLVIFDWILSYVEFIKFFDKEKFVLELLYCICV